VIAGARLGVLVLALAALGMLVLGPRQAGDPTARPYVCPMHPEVATQAPGPCPVCGMALERRPAAPTSPAGDADSAVQAARFLGYGAAPVHRRALGASAEWPAWLDTQGGVTAVLFADELRDLEGHGSFFAARTPGSGLTVERAPAPPIPWRGSLWRVRFRFGAGPPRGLRVGAAGWLAWPLPGRQSLVVLSSAVLQSGAGPRVLVSAPDGRSYRSQPVVTGRALGGYTVVVSGARERDLVFGLNAFSLEADAHLRTQRRAAAEKIAP
jgi:hypothetical protein